MIVAWPLLLLSAALAHQPAVIDEQHTVERPEISWALYGSFETGDEHFVVVLPLERDFALPFELLVPHRRALRDHRPRFAVVGPGLPPPSETERQALPRALPDGWGAFVELHDDPDRAVIFEGFSRRFFWSTTPTALPLAGQTHEIWIWSPDATRGDFVLGLGVEEDFGDVDWGEMLADWPDVAW